MDAVPVRPARRPRSGHVSCGGPGEDPAPPQATLA